MSCSKAEALKFTVRIAEAEAENRHSARRVFLESRSSSADIDDRLLALIEDLVVDAEMKRTRSCVSLEQHTHNCLFCSRPNSN
jgi:hypothetical protein